MKHTLIDTGLGGGAIKAPALQDSFGRTVTYLRLSVTDRCDLRCAYCMPERMKFLPRADLLSFEELARLVDGFVARGISKLRVTGGEPLVRKDVMKLFEYFSKRLGSNGLKELTLTTNATQLAPHAKALVDYGVKRINVSLDTRDRDRFAALTRRDALPQVLEGLNAAADAGLKVKINTVALAHTNGAELPELIKWAHGRGFDLTLIESMPMGEISEDRSDEFLSLAAVRERLEAQWRLEDLSDNTPLFC